MASIADSQPSERSTTMNDSIKLQVEIEYWFRWQRPDFKEKVEVLTRNGLLCVVDKCGTLSVAGNNDPESKEVSAAARRWAGWITEKPEPLPTAMPDEIDVLTAAIIGKTIVAVNRVRSKYEDDGFELVFSDTTRVRVETSEWLRIYINGRPSD